MPKLKKQLALLSLLTLFSFIGVGLTSLPASANIYGDYLNSLQAKKLHDYPQAAKLLDRVLKAKPDDRRISQEALLAFIYAGQYDRMEKLAQEIIATDENAPARAHYIDGLSAMSKGDYDRAVNVFSSMLHEIGNLISKNEMS